MLASKAWSQMSDKMGHWIWHGSMFLESDGLDVWLGSLSDCMFVWLNVSVLLRCVFQA